MTDERKATVDWNFDEDATEVCDGVVASDEVEGRANWLRKCLGLAADHTPFPWQEELLCRFERGEVPGSLDIPTGLGKTSVMAIWLIARALGATVPRRLVYVVDRRAVVDQATAVAEQLRACVDSAASLKSALGLGRRSLPISTLRGQHIDNRQWLEDPASAAIIVGTIAMVGSRLLFEGYSVSRKMRPYHAGLLGVDTLIVLDEAHLVPAFERLVDSIASAGVHGLGPSSEAAALVPPFRLLSLSATGRTTRDPLTLGADDYRHPVVAERVHASKTVVLRSPAPKNELAGRLAEEAFGIASSSNEPMRIIVFCDTRDDATKVEKELSKRIGKPRPDSPVLELFVGARRAHERSTVAKWLDQHGFTGGGRPAVTTFLIATSAAEVGVDLDSDAAVADVVAWERMVQRLGRVNRRGKRAARVVLVPLAGEERDPERRQACVSLLERLPGNADGADASPAAFVALRERAIQEAEIARLIADATTPAPLHPPLSRATVDAWSMTSLDTHTGRPEVEPWLQGWVEDDEPRATIAFREHLPLVGGRVIFDETALDAFLEAAAPQLAEQLETEVWRALDWLDKRVKVMPKAAGSAAPGHPDTPVAIAFARTRGATVVTRSSLRDKRERQRLERTLANGWLMVDARLGGLRRGLLEPDASHPGPDEQSDLTLAEVLPFRVRRVESLDPDGSATEYRREKSFVIAHDDEGIASAWLVVERRKQALPVTEAGRSIARRAQGLEEHQGWVEREVTGIAQRLGLDDRLTRALRVAGRLHDEGKRAERWQRAFQVPLDLRPLAKSTRAPNVALLGGYRHELGSLSRMEQDPEFLSLDEDLRDLALHLVAAHHGRARPVLPTDGAEEPPTRLRERAQEVALRFARLSLRFGPWGLAWLESLLRAADQRASRLNDEGSDD